MWSRALEGTTDSRGRVEMGAFPGRPSRRFASQATWFRHTALAVDEAADSTASKSFSKDVLAPVGRVVGRLLPPGNEPIKGVTVRATTQEGGYEGSGRGGMAEVAVQDSGRFEIGAIVAGSSEIELAF